VNLQRPHSVFLLMVLGMTAMMLTTAIALQFYLFRLDRLHLLEQVNGGLAREFAGLVQQQAEAGLPLDGASRVLARVVHLENRSGLVSVVAVTSNAGERAFYFDDHPQGSHATPPLLPATIERDWQLIRSSPDAQSAIWSRTYDGMLYIAAPIQSREAASQGMLIIGLADPVSWGSFLLGSHSPLVAAAWILYLSAAIGLFAAYRVRRKFAALASAEAALPLQDAGAPLDRALVRAEEALAQLTRMAR
jgi:hypothetical protein